MPQESNCSATGSPAERAEPLLAKTLKDNDPQRKDLESAGWRLVATSWGARLCANESDLPRLRALVRRAQERGYDITELTDRDAGHVCALEMATLPDYPLGVPATTRAPLTLAGAASLFHDGRVFGAWHGVDLVAVTATELLSSRVETSFTSVRSDHRRQGVATALKALSVLAHLEQGMTTFGTGGAQINDASLKINLAMGYRIVETWLTYESADRFERDSPPST